MARKKQKKQSRSPRPLLVVAAGPVNRSSGLSSRPNREYVLQILNHSTREQITELLSRAGSQPTQKPGRTVRSESFDGAVERRLASFLQSADGQERLRRKEDDMVSLEATKWLRTPEGQSKFRQAKAQVLASEVASDNDLFGRVCRDEITRRVEKWLKSPSGQEAVELEKKRAVQKLLKQPPPTGQPTWVEQQLKETKRHE